jgi:hypothetical protein
VDLDGLRRSAIAADKRTSQYEFSFVTTAETISKGVFQVRPRSTAHPPTRPVLGRNASEHLGWVKEGYPAETGEPSDRYSLASLYFRQFAMTSAAASSGDLPFVEVSVTRRFRPGAVLACSSGTDSSESSGTGSPHGR